MSQEAKIVGESRVIKNVLNFTAKAIDKSVDMGSICGRCSLNEICFGTLYPSYKEAKINLSSTRIKKIDPSKDTSNCGIIIDIMARKDSVQEGFTPQRRAFGTN